MLDLVNLLTDILLGILRDLRPHRLTLTATLARALKVREVCLSTMATYLTNQTDTQPLKPGASPYYGGEQMGYPPASQSPDPRNRTPSGGSPYQQPQQPPVTDAYQPVHHRPQSTYDHPQELGTSVYDSPVDRPAAQQLPYPSGGHVPPVMQRFQQQQQQAQAQQEYSPSAYSPDEPSSQGPYPTAPDAPMHQPPPVPTGAAAKPTTPYPSLTPGVPSGEGYQAYNPSSSNPNLFYR